MIGLGKLIQIPDCIDTSSVVGGGVLEVGGGEAVGGGTVMSAGNSAGDSLSEAAVSNREAADSNGIVIAGTETG